MKVELGPLNCLYPLPTTLVGALVNGKPNYVAIAHVGILDLHHISLGMNRAHYTNAGIIEQRAFSVNYPSTAMVEVTDYCGLASGKRVDKGALFEAFYGTLGNAPMIRGCPLNMECRLAQTLELATHDVFVGEVVAAYCDEECMTDGAPDWAKLKPILFSMLDKGYWRLGERFARAWSVGKSYGQSSDA